MNTKIYDFFKETANLFGIRDYSYSIDKEKDEIVCIIHNGDKTVVYIPERNEVHDKKEFKNRENAYDYALELLTSSEEVAESAKKYFKNLIKNYLKK